MNENPYSAPIVKSSIVKSDSNYLPLATHILLKTRPWVRIMSVLTLLGAVFGGVAGVVSSVGPGGIWAASIYLITGLIYLFPGIYLWQFASRITLFARDQSEGMLAQALESQKSFWKFCAIFSIIAIALYTFLLLFLILQLV